MKSDVEIIIILKKKCINHFMRIFEKYSTCTHIKPTDNNIG